MTKRILSTPEKIELLRNQLPRLFEIAGVPSNKAKMFAGIVPEGALRMEARRPGEHIENLSATGVHRLLEAARTHAETVRKLTAPSPLRAVGVRPAKAPWKPGSTSRLGRKQANARRQTGSR